MTVRPGSVPPDGDSWAAVGLLAVTADVASVLPHVWALAGNTESPATTVIALPEARLAK